MTRKFDPLSTAGPHRALYLACLALYLIALGVLMFAGVPPSGAWHAAAFAAPAALSAALLAIVVRAVFADTDEFQRRVKGEAMAWASAVVLVALVALGFAKLGLPSRASPAADRTFLSTVMANVIPIWIGVYTLAFRLIGDRYE
jgi:hypothetical protein